MGWTNGAITNSYATGDVEATSTASNTSPNGGGLVGLTYGTIVNSYATGDVTVSGTRWPTAGGLAGSLSGGGKIVNSYATGDVEVNNSTHNSYGGGLAGASGSGTTIQNSYARGDVTVSSPSGDSYGGGLVGLNGGIVNSYATGSVGCGGTCPNPIFGGLLGGNRSGGSVTGTNYFVDDQGGADGVGSGTCAMGAVCQRRTFVELGALTSVTGWEASDWDFDTATQLPRLKYTEEAAYCTDSSYTSKSRLARP